MFSVVFLGSIVTAVVSCPPGIGTDATIVTNPQFTFSFYPPARWTYYNVSLLIVRFQKQSRFRVVSRTFKKEYFLLVST